jgi:hypothetical protein
MALIYNLQSAIWTAASNLRVTALSEGFLVVGDSRKASSEIVKSRIDFFH